MLALAVVAIWVGVVAFYLVRQWWVSELAQVQEGVPAPAPVALPAAPAARPALSPRTTTWSTRHVPAAAAR
jgi:apolipoprotein N-acyltransferase